MSASVCSTESCRWAAISERSSERMRSRRSVAEVAPQPHDPRPEQQRDTGAGGEHDQADAADGGQHATRREQRAEPHHEEHAATGRSPEEAAGAVLLVGARPHEPEADRGQHHGPHDARREDQPGAGEQEHGAEGEEAEADGPLGRGRTGRRRWRGGVLVGKQRPAREVQQRADAVGEGEHHEGEAHDVRVDAEVAAHAARHARHHAVVAGADEPVGQVERARVEAEPGGRGFAMVVR